MPSDPGELEPRMRLEKTMAERVHHIASLHACTIAYCYGQDGYIQPNPPTYVYLYLTTHQRLMHTAYPVPG